MVITRSVSGIKEERAFKKVVFPEFVPPQTNRLYFAFTSCSKNWADSSVSAWKRISFSMVMGSGNLRMVTTGPSSATGGSTMWTLDPSSSLASAMGEDTLTIRFTFPTICWIMSSNCSVFSNRRFHKTMFPFFSIKIFPAPLIMISVTSLSSKSSWRISSRRKLSYRLFRSHSRSFKGR